jgi:hypothetical protein
VKKISPFLNDASLLGAYQKTGRALAESKYSRKKLGDKFFEIVSDSIPK